MYKTCDVKIHHRKHASTKPLRSQPGQPREADTHKSASAKTTTQIIKNGALSPAAQRSKLTHTRRGRCDTRITLQIHLCPSTNRVISWRSTPGIETETAKDRSQMTAVFRVGIDLSSRSVSRQVLSALVSLTSVFGMGTGGPSPLKTPTMNPRGTPQGWYTIRDSNPGHPD